MLLQMEDLPLVRPDAPQIGRRPENPVIFTDGVSHTFWNRFATSRFEGAENSALVSLEIDGNVNSPVAIWWAKAVQGMRDCWSPTPPDGLAEK